MTPDEKLDQILALLYSVAARVDAIEEKLGLSTPPATPTGLLGLFVRPGLAEDGYGLGSRMTVADPAEAIRRACGNVLWNGDIALTESERDARWNLVEALLAAKETDEIVDPYRMLDPAFALFGLLTDAVPPHTADGPSFGVTKNRREALAGKTIETFLADQLGVAGGPGIG